MIARVTTKNWRDATAPAPGGGDSDGGGKAFLFEVKGMAVLECGGATATDASFGNVSWSGNILWDPLNIHVHFKLQLKDVDPNIDPKGYQIFGNYDMSPVDQSVGCALNNVDFAACEGGVCDVRITVKQNGQGRTSGVLQLPGDKPGMPVTVWVTVTVNNDTKILRSTPVTMVLPPNAVGGG